MSGRARKENASPLKRGTFLFFSGAVFLFDQITKTCVRTALAPSQSLPVLGNFFYLTLVENKGIAFGLFRDGDRVLFLLITLSIVALAVTGLMARSLRLATEAALGLILGGALGNWLDRIRFGAVVDFLDFRVWPVFNLADTAITVGVGIFLLDLLKSDRHAS